MTQILGSWLVIEISILGMGKEIQLVSVIPVSHHPPHTWACCSKLRAAGLHGLTNRNHGQTYHQEGVVFGLWKTSFIKSMIVNNISYSDDFCFRNISHLCPYPASHWPRLSVGLSFSACPAVRPVKLPKVGLEFIKSSWLRLENYYPYIAWISIT